MSIFLICKHIIQESLESGPRQSTGNVTKMYYMITPCQNERYRTFGMLVAGTSVIALQVCFVALVLLFLAFRDGITRQETLLTHPGRHDLRQRRRDGTVRLLSCKYAIGHSWHL